MTSSLASPRETLMQCTVAQEQRFQAERRATRLSLPFPSLLPSQQTNQNGSPHVLLLVREPH